MRTEQDPYVFMKIQNGREIYLDMENVPDDNVTAFVLEKAWLNFDKLGQNLNQRPHRALNHTHMVAWQVGPNVFESTFADLASAKESADNLSKHVSTMIVSKGAQPDFLG